MGLLGRHRSELPPRADGLAALIARMAQGDEQARGDFFDQTLGRAHALAPDALKRFFRNW